MPLFPSEEWMRELCTRLEAKPEAPELAATMAGAYRFVIEPAGPLAQRHRYDIEVVADGGDPRVRLLDEEAPAPRLTLTADYARWRQLVLGQLDIPMAFLLRRLRVSGDLAGVVGGGTSARPLMEALQEVDSVWLEDAR